MPLYTSGQTRRSLIDTVAFRAVSQIATILGYIVMVRSMTKEDFGIFNLLYAFIPVVSTVASLGLEQTLRRYQPEYLKAGNDTAASWLLKFVASARFGANVVVLGLILLGWNQVAPIFALTPYRAEFVVFCTLVLLHFQASILQLSLASQMLHRYSVGSTAILAISKLVGYGALAINDGLTLDRAILIDTVATGLTFVFLLIAYRKHRTTSDQSLTFRPSAGERRRLLRYGLFNNFNDAGTLFLNSKTDNFYIAALLDPVSVGLYSFYTRLNEMAQNLVPVRFFENVIQPVFFSLPRAEADNKVPQYFSLLLNLNLLWQWPVLTFTVVYHAELVQVVFGGKFVEDSWLLPVIVSFASFNVISIPVTLVAQYEEKAAVILLSKIFGIYNVLALLTLTPMLGVYGAAIASGSAQAMKNSFIWWRVRERARWVNAKAALLSGSVLWVGAIALCFLLKRVVVDSPVINMGLGVVVIVVCSLIHVRTPAVSVADRASLSAVVHGRERVFFRRLGLLDS